LASVDNGDGKKFYHEDSKCTKEERLRIDRLVFSKFFPDAMERPAVVPYRFWALSLGGSIPLLRTLVSSW
jgi:hypothetical protein